jgi:hypothetical protein
MLSLCVLDADKQPIYTPDEWYAFASRHIDAAMRLWDLARTLSGIGDVDPKKDLAPKWPLPAPYVSDSGELSESCSPAE